MYLHFITGQSNPYCEVSMGSQEHKTKVIANTLNPRWNASMQFLVKNLHEDVLCISVFDRDLFSPNGNNFCCLEIHVSSILKKLFSFKKKRNSIK